MLIWNKALRERKGFLLLEVLVSITIISVGLVYIVRSFSSSTRAIETASRYLKSISLVEEKIWELEAKETIENKKDAGSFKDEEQYRWVLESEPLKDTPINTVKLKVEWEAPQRRQRVSIETYLWNEEE